MILSKNQTFFYRRFSHNLCQKRSLFDILNRKQSFLDQKIEVLKRAKNGLFPNGLVHGFCPKMEISLIAFLTESMSEKIVFRYFGKKAIIFRPKN